jgi:hypothetical protein
MNDAEAMKTYFAEIHGQAVVAFRAMDDEDAHDMVNIEYDDEAPQRNTSFTGHPQDLVKVTRSIR